MSDTTNDTTPDNEDSDAVRIPLLGGSAHAAVDRDDVALIAGYQWSYRRAQGREYAFRRVKCDGRSIFVFMHDVILPPQNQLRPDHIDGNGLNNRRSNLRLATHTQNMQNRKRASSNTSGYKGVLIDKRYGRWYAQIKAFGVRYRSGWCAVPEEAARLYDDLARQLHGDFARLNFPREGERRA